MFTLSVLELPYFYIVYIFLFFYVLSAHNTQDSIITYISILGF